MKRKPDPSIPEQNKQLIVHVTNTLSALRSILKSSSLQLSYCKEDFCIGAQKISRAAHPMVCFCEYNIDEIGSKTITYGKYGIAFSTGWAHKKRISPVLYIDGNSIAGKGLGALLKARRNRNNPIPEHLRLPIMEIKCFTKNIRGYNSYLKEENFDFRSENEWRYVPRKKEIGNNLISQHKNTYLKNPDKYNNKLMPYPLRFKQSEIEYVFISKQEEADTVSKEFSISFDKIIVSKWETKLHLNKIHI